MSTRTNRCTDVSRFNDLIDTGYRHVESSRYRAAADAWQEAWEALKAALPGHLRSIEDATLAVSQKAILSFWCQDFADVLGRVGAFDEKYARMQADLVREVFDRFPETNRIVLFGLKLAEARACTTRGRQDLAGRLYEAIRRDFPGLLLLDGARLDRHM
jgi:hypothetical protein